MNAWRRNLMSIARGVGNAARVASLITLLTIIGCGKEESPKKPPTSQASSIETNAQTRPKVFTAAAAPAPKPTAPLPAGASCVTPACHARLGASAQIHAPIAENACNTCHSDDRGDHTFPLLRANDQQTCGFCHVANEIQPHQHEALKEGCTKCHDPHASNTKFLLKAQDVESLCRTCHESKLQSHAHEPFLKGDCTLCHQPHEADNPKLLRGGATPGHCYQCHDDIRQRMQNSAAQHEPARDCMKCHEAHTANQPALLIARTEELCIGCHKDVRHELATDAPRHGALDEPGSCANCHDPHAADAPLLLNDRMDRVCLSCHSKDIRTADGRVLAEMKTVLTQSKFLHGAIKLGDCSACHRGHTSHQPMLLTASFPESSYAHFDVKIYDLCFESCHSPEIVLKDTTVALTNFRNGEQNLHYIHVNRSEKGRSCKTCHAMHGSNLPNHMASDVPFERSGWAMQIGFSKSADGGTCSPGCHTARTYQRSIAATQPATQPSAPSATLISTGVHP